MWCGAPPAAGRTADVGLTSSWVRPWLAKKLASWARKPLACSGSSAEIGTARRGCSSCSLPSDSSRSLGPLGCHWEPLVLGSAESASASPCAVLRLARCMAGVHEQWGRSRVSKKAMSASPLHAFFLFLLRRRMYINSGF